MANINVNIKKINNNIELPKYQTSGSAGLDLVASINEDIVIGIGDIKLIPTGIAIELESSDYVACVFARSGLASKHGITMANCVGVIDSDYRGEIKCAIINLGNKEYTIKPFERIAQLVFMPVMQANIVLADELGETQRGEGGFGSTGK